MDIVRWIEENQDQFIALSCKIWEFAEIAYQEHKSAKLLEDTLEEAGFTVNHGIAEIPTAFVASYGEGSPVIAILGEYDALPSLSQAVSPERNPIVPGGHGHGCGHNLLGVAGLAAAMALKEALQAGELEGTLRYYGCPAEENGSGKAFMVKAGVFEGVDLSLTWHPGVFNGGVGVNNLANYKVKFKFKGVAAHAASAPHNGRSALDAVELMNVGVNYLREHVIPEARLHYAVLNTGGPAPNVVQPEAESLYIIRAPHVGQVEKIYQRVKDVAKGAALMTGTEVEINFYAGASNLLLNDTILDVLVDTLNEIGPPKFTIEEKAFAAEISKTLSKEAAQVELDRYRKLLGPGNSEVLEGVREGVLFEDVLPAIKKDEAMPGSTDVGDVSWVTPTGQITTTCRVFGTPGHSWQLVAQGGMGIGMKGMLYAAKVMGKSAAKFFQDHDLLEKAKTEFAERRRDNPYISPIPDGVKPPIVKVDDLLASAH